ncbi:MAG: hypothetical protein AAF291_02005 [Pseudomonadota bacterium]
MLDLFAFDHRSLIQDFLTCAICVAAFVWGAGPERAVILIWVVTFEILMVPYRAMWGASIQLQTIDVSFVVADLVAGILWVIVALNANRVYPLFIAALQILIVAAHMVRGVIEAISPAAYAVMFTAPGWLQLVIMAVGLSRHIQRERQYGPYRDWRSPSPWFTWLSYRWRQT